VIALSYTQRKLHQDIQWRRPILAYDTLLSVTENLVDVVTGGLEVQDVRNGAVEGKEPL
jgi:hypothetical protein